MAEAASGVSQGEDVVKSKDPIHYLLAVAIDIGTSSSCYAYSFTTNNITHFSKFKFKGSLPGAVAYDKAPTSVLTESGPNGKFVSFGYKAEDDYLNKLSSDKDKKYHLYQDFKMELYRKLSKDTDSPADSLDNPEYENQNLIMIESLDGTKRPLKDIYVMLLEELVRHMDSARELGGHSVVPKNRIRWVLCVPATWSDRAKHFIRRSAYEAGIIDDPLSDQLHIILESTAAGLFCCLPETRFSRKHTEKNEVPTGTKYLVIDAGAGTADLAAQQVIERKEKSKEKDREASTRKAVEEVEVANGGDWGARYGDKVFMEKFGEFVGERLFKQFKQMYPADWLDIQISFDRAKSSADTDETVIQFKLPQRLFQFFFKNGKDLLEMLDSEGTPFGFSQIRGELAISRETIDTYYQPVIDKIVNSALSMLNGKRLKDSDLKEIFLVGGFANSKRLQDCIKERCHNKRVSIPSNAKAGVITGAIQYALNPSIITFMATKTYGTRTFTTFDAQKHDIRKKVVISGEILCKDVFTPFINKDEHIFPDHVGHASLMPVNAAANFVDLEFYVMDRAKQPDEIIYVDELERLEHIRVPLSETKGGCQREVFLTFTFGDEIRIKASHMESGEVLHCEITFGHEKHVECVL